MTEPFFEGQAPDRLRAIRLSDELGYQCAKLTATWIEVYVHMRRLAETPPSRADLDDLDDAERDLLALVDDHDMPIPVAVVAVALQFRSFPIARHAATRLLERESAALADAGARAQRKDIGRRISRARAIVDELQRIEREGITSWL